MSSQPISVLKANMPSDGIGGVSAMDIHDILDSLDDRTTQGIVTKTDSYTAILSDNRRKLSFVSSDPVILFLPNNIPSGWECMVCQAGVGRVTLIATGGGMLLSRGGHERTAGQNAVAYLLCIANSGASPQIILAGDTAISANVAGAFSSAFSTGFA